MLTVPFSALGFGPAQPTPAAFPANLHQHPLREVAVDAPNRRPGDADFPQGGVACMAHESSKRLSTEAATAVVSSARSLPKELPDDDLSVHMA